MWFFARPHTNEKVNAGTGALKLASSTSKIDDIGKRRVEIEEFVSEARLTDAFNLLQDLVRDYALQFLNDVLNLRKRYETLPALLPGHPSNAGTIEPFLRAILEWAYRIETLALDEPAPVTPKPGRRINRNVVLECQEASVRVSPAFSLKDLSFSLGNGEILGVVGRNASGKTTLLRMILGHFIPDSGQLIYHNMGRGPTDWLGIKSQLAYVPQSPSPWQGRLRNILNYVTRTSGVPGEEVTERVDWTLARYDMSKYADASWDQLSGGYKTRFELVRALLTRPKLLILDEPLAYLDFIAIQRFLMDLRSLADSKENPLPIIVTSQHLNEIEAIADQIMLLNDGVCQYAGPIDEIAGHIKYRLVEVGLKARKADLDAALTGLGVHSVETSLEGFILSLNKTQDLSLLFNRLRAAFGEDLTSMRDITGSSRALIIGETQ